MPPGSLDSPTFRPMTSRQYLRLATALPFLVPPIAFLAGRAAMAIRPFPPDGFVADLIQLSDLLVFAAIASAIPYGIYIAVQLYRLRNADATAHWRALWQGPIVVSAVVGLVALVMALANAGIERGSFGVPLFIAFLGLLIGAAYAAAIGATHWILARAGCVHE